MGTSSLLNGHVTGREPTRPREVGTDRIDQNEAADDVVGPQAEAEGRYRSIRAKLEREIDRLHDLADAATKQRVVLHPNVRAVWGEADFQQRRELVRLVVDRVTVMPGRPGVGRFDRSRVRIEIKPWRRVNNGRKDQDSKQQCDGRDA